MNKPHIYTASAIAALLLAACAQEEPAGTQTQATLHPVTVTATWQPSASDRPRARVVDTRNGETVSSSWTEGDKICVTVSSLSTARSVATTCALRSDGRVSSYDPQIYWHTAGWNTIDAWFSNIAGNATTDNTVNLSDQTAALAYVMKAEPKTYLYLLKPMDDIQLTFVHQLAKVRVKLSAAAGSGIDLTTASVRLRQCFTACTVSGGTVTPSGNADGKIAMMPPDNADAFFEANVIPDTPGTIRQNNVIEVTAGGKVTTHTLSRPITLEAGKMYTLHFTLK